MVFNDRSVQVTGQGRWAVAVNGFSATFLVCTFWSLLHHVTFLESGLTFQSSSDQQTRGPCCRHLLQVTGGGFHAAGPPAGGPRQDFRPLLGARYLPGGS